VTAAENSFIGIEHLTEEEVNEFRKKVQNSSGKSKERRAFCRQKDSCQSQEGRGQDRIAFSLTNTPSDGMSTQQQTNASVCPASEQVLFF
jgi:hypothetical protein